MRNRNELTLRGNLGGDPEMFETGKSKGCRLRLATNRTYTQTVDGEEKQVKDTTWHPCTVWGEQAVKIAANLKVGDEVQVQGRVEIRRGTDQNKVEHDYYNVHVFEVQKVVDPSR